MKQQFLSLLILFLLVQSCNRFSAEGTSKHKIVWQPSHQTDTGKDFSEAATCNGIVEAAMAAAPSLKEYKVWSLGINNIIMPTPGAIPKYCTPLR